MRRVLAAHIGLRWLSGVVLLMNEDVRSYIALENQLAGQCAPGGPLIYASFL